MASNPPDPFARFRRQGTDVPIPGTDVPIPTDQPAASAGAPDPFARFRRDSGIAPEVPRENNTLGEEFRAGLGQGIDSLQGSLYGVAGLMGRELGIEWLENAGIEGAARNFEEAASSTRQSGGFSDIDSAGGFFRWASASLGEAIPSLTSMFASGGIGAAAGRAAVHRGVKRAVARKVERDLVEKGFGRAEALESVKGLMNTPTGQKMIGQAFVDQRRAIAKLGGKAARKGGGIGAYAAGTLPQIGQIDLELQERGIDAGMTAVLGGMLGGALEAVPALRLMDKLFPGVDRKVAKNFVKDFAVATGTQAALEGSTEAAQEMIQLAALAYHDPSFDMFSADARTRMVDAFAAGALVGAVTGGGAEAVSEGVTRGKRAALKAATKAKANMPEFSLDDGDATQDEYPDGFKPADNTVYEEIRSRVFGAVQPSIDAAVNSGRNALQNAIDRLDEVMAGGVNEDTEKFSELVMKYHNEFFGKHKAQLDSAKEYLKKQTRWIYEQAEKIKDPAQREEFINTHVEATKEKLRSVVENLRRSAAQRDQRTEAEIDDMDFDDTELQQFEQAVDEEGEIVDVEEDALGTTRDVLPEESEKRTGPSGRKFTRQRGPERPAELSPSEQVSQVLDDAPEKYVLGKFEKQGTVDAKGDQKVRGYDTRGQAEKALEKTIPQIFPSATESTFEIREQDDGTFVIGVAEIGKGEQLAHDKRVYDGVKASRRSARKNRSQDRPRVKFEGRAPLDLETLAYAGRDLTRKFAETDMRNGLQNMLAVMLDNGWINNDQAVEAMNVWDEHQKRKAKEKAEAAGRPAPEAKPEPKRRETPTELSNKGHAQAVMFQMIDDFARQAMPEEVYNTWKRYQAALRDKQVPQKKGKPRKLGREQLKRLRREVEAMEVEHGVGKARAFLAIRQNKNGTYSVGIVPRKALVESEGGREVLTALQGIVAEQREEAALQEGQRDPREFEDTARIKTTERVPTVEREQAPRGRTKPSEAKPFGAPIEQPTVTTAATARSGELLDTDQQADDILTQPEQLEEEFEDRRRELERTPELERKGKPDPREAKFGADVSQSDKLLNARGKTQVYINEQTVFSAVGTGKSQAQVDKQIADVEAKIAKDEKELESLGDKKILYKNMTEKQVSDVNAHNNLIDFLTKRIKKNQELLAKRRREREVARPGVTKGTKDNIARVVKWVQKTLGLGNMIVVLDRANMMAMIERGRLTDPAFAKTIAEDPPARNIRINDTSFIYLSDRVLAKPGATLLALGHELGHQLYSVEWKNLTAEKRAALMQAFLDDKYNGTFGNKDESQLNAEFNEWMADQLAAWIVAEGRKPNNPVERFFSELGAKIRQLWDYITQNPRFELNSTFKEFADTVAARARSADGKGDPLAHRRVEEWFQDFGSVAYKWWGPLPQMDDMANDIVIRKPELDERTIKKIQERFTDRFPNVAKRAALLRQWMFKAYDLILAPSTSVMRTLGKRIDAAQELVSIFGRENHGERKKSSNYHQRVNLMRGQFMEEMYDKLVTKPLKARAKREAEAKSFPNKRTRNKWIQTREFELKRQLIKSLRQKEGNPDATFTPHERAVRRLFDEMHDYARESGLPVGHIVNYVPRVFDREMLIKNKDEIIDHIMGRERWSRSRARHFYNSLIDPDATDGRATWDAIETPGFRNMNSRTSQDKFFDKYLDENLDGVVSNYVNSLVKRAEFNRFLGEDRAPDPEGRSPQELIKEGLWDPKGKLHLLLEQARDQGATDEEIQQMEKFIDANLGMLGRDDISPGLRKFFAGAVAYQNMRVLMFTVFASLPDMVGPSIRSGSMRESFRSTMQNLREIARDDSELAEMSRALGIASSAANQHIMTEYVDNHYMPPTLRKMNDAFFKWTGLNFYTDMTRRMALAVGRDYIIRMADQAKNAQNEKDRFKAQAALEELGLDEGIVTQWIQRGKPTYGSVATDTKSPIDLKVAEALVQFVDESIMRPNASQRPILASHPGAMLMYHLKGYLYAVHEVVLKRIKHNIDEAEGTQQYLSAIAPAVAMMLLTAVGLELREIIQYAGSNRTPPTDRMDGWEYTWELFSRAGLTGITQLGFDFEGASDRGLSEVAGIGGPTLAQIGEAISRPYTQTIPKSVPILGQMPAGRDAIRTFL